MADAGVRDEAGRVALWRYQDAKDRWLATRPGTIQQMDAWVTMTRAWLALDDDTQHVLVLARERELRQRRRGA